MNKKRDFFGLAFALRLNVNELQYLNLDSASVADMVHIRTVIREMIRVLRECDNSIRDEIKRQHKERYG